MTKRSRHLLLTASALILAAVLAGCFSQPATPTPIPADDGEGDQFIGVPNPASFYCQEMGYELELRETSQGTTGICRLPDGKECEEWEFLAGACGIEWTFCARQGHTLQAGDGIATCTFADGSSCPEYDFFIQECQAPE